MRKVISIAIIKLERDLGGYKGFSAKLCLIFAENFSMKMISPNKFHEQIKRFEQTIVGNCLETRLWNGRPQSWRSVHFQKQFNGNLVYFEAKVYLNIWKIWDFDMGGPLYQVIQVCGLHFEDNWPIIRYEEAVSTHAA